MIKTEISNFLNSLDRSPRTVFAYRNALQQFLKVVGKDAELNTATYIRFLVSLQNKSPSTQRVYITAVLKFYTFCKAGNWNELQKATQHYRHKSAKRIVRFNREAVEKVIVYCESLNGEASTSLCGIIEKSDNKDVIRFSKRSIRALREYLLARSSVEPNSRQLPASQPLFARHDIRASKKIRPITPGGMWKAIKSRITEAGVDRSTVRIHDFRHYFVTRIYLTKKDLKLSQELARHKSISTTYRYAHLGSEVDTSYEEIFDKKK